MNRKKKYNFVICNFVCIQNHDFHFVLNLFIGYYYMVHIIIVIIII
jgi:hypothetical protein